MAEARAIKRLSKCLEIIKTQIEAFSINTPISEIRTSMDLLAGEWKEFQVLERTVKGKFDDAHIDAVEKIEQDHFTLKQRIIRWEKQNELSTAQPHQENSTMQELLLNQSNFLQEISTMNKRDSEVRLPRVNIPQFSGNYSEFPSFKDLFEASIDKNEHMSKVHKLQYLKSLLKGEAYTLISHLNVTDVNYTQAWEKVKERYDKPKHVVYTLVKQFMNQPALQESSPKGLRRLTDISDEVIRGLHVLGEEADKRDIWLIYILVHKLDADSREAWAHYSTNQHFPSLEAFFRFLSSRSDALECIISTQKQKPPLQKRVGAMTSQVAIGGVCPMCSENYYLSKCSKYLDLSSSDRKGFVTNKKLCYNCLSSTHQSVVCRSKYVCRICKRKHHVTLHLEASTNSSTNSRHEQGEPASSVPVKTTEPSSVPVKTSESAVCVAVKSQAGTVNAPHYQAILPTAIVLIGDKFGRMQRCRALLDSGSQSSFITERCAKRLQLVQDKANLRITGLTDGSINSRRKSTVVLYSLYDSKIKTVLDVYVIKQLPTRIPSTHIYLNNKDVMNNVDLADPNFDTPGHIDVLIGADKFFEVLEEDKRHFKSLILSKTIFGWIVSGQPQSSISEKVVAYTTITHDESGLQSTLKKFWEIEDIPTSIDKLTPEEKECEDLFEDTHQRTNEGRYMVKLPIRKDSGALGDSLRMATTRFRTLEHKLAMNHKLREEYIKQMREYITLGHMMEVPIHRTNNERLAHEIYYLPHHPVINVKSEKTKMRIVFDGSSKTTSGVSLNDKLMIGPTIQSTLWEIILRFRTNKVALVADIEKMYRQFIVSPEHQNYQMVLWRERPDEKLKTYQPTRVTFGLACSSFLAIRAMQQLANGLVEANIKKCILNDFYVDDLLSGSLDVQHAEELKKGVTDVLEKGGFSLRKWRSNVNCLSEPNDETAVSEICSDENLTTKALGLQWNRLNDTFTFKIQGEKDGAITKRKIISESSRLFDPMGFLSPSIILLKILFQKLWIINVGWDDKLQPEIENEYVDIRSKFIHFEKIAIPRFTNLYGQVQIHGFADSSEVAYCAVVYSRVVLRDGCIAIQLLTSKTKVAPIKRISLPRLELCAAHLLSKLMSKVKEALKSDDQYFAWTDSAIVLAWLSAHPSRWKTFVANRTSQIKESLPRCHWGHVKSKDNPADHGSRGVSPEKLINLTQWWNGPEWLVLPQTAWPTNEINKLRDADYDMEYSKIASSSTVLKAECENNKNSWIEELFERKSDLQRIYRIVAYVLRFVKSLRNHQSKITTQLTSIEITEAKFKCITWVQHMEFEAEILSIRRQNRVSNKSKLLSLAPFIDEKGILRVGGRLQNSDCDYGSKHPIILPQKHIFTIRVIWDMHLRNLHAGPTLTASFIKQEYWIINGRSSIRNILRECVMCTRYAAKASKQLMGNLPAVRVTPTRPFENTGIDFAGPIYVATRKGRGCGSPVKGYICIFVCLSVKAIHIEGVTDLTSDAFLAALKRFTARRGLPKNIYTDNGSNFIGAKRILEQACKLIKNISNDYIITEFLSRNSIEWHFIPPFSPHFGGLWEAAVKSVKRHLLRATHNINITFEEMTTMLCQIENILNSRPLYASPAEEDYDVLTPAHFLIGTSTSSIPEFELDQPRGKLSRWQAVQKRVQLFWKRYYLEYVNNMQQRHKWQGIQENFKIDDIVLMKEDNVPVCKWPFGRVINVHPGSDGLVRAVTLKTSSSILQRPVIKLCKLLKG